MTLHEIFAMKSKKFSASARNGIAGAAIMLMAAVPAVAQDAPSAAPAANPAITDTHTSGSWSVRCYHAGTVVCDLTQASYTRSKNLRVASIAIGYIVKSNQFIGRFIVPLGVSFDQGLTIEIGSYRAQNLKYRRCEREGCYVEGILPQPLLDAMQTPGLEKGAMDIVSIDGRKVQIPIVLDGFSDGLSQLKEWSIQKASSGKAKDAKDSKG